MVTTRSGLVSDKGKQVPKQHKSDKKSSKKVDVKDKPAKKSAVSPKNQKNSKIQMKKSSPKPTPKPKDQLQSPKPQAKSSSPPPSPPPSSNNSIYTFDQFQSFKKFKDELNEKKLQDLKEMCKLNDMKVSGTKTELIERIADAKVLGVIPKCPSCGGGRPKLNPKMRTYYCSGYLDDTIFKNCHKTFAYSEIVREPWKDS